MIAEACVGIGYNIARVDKEEFCIRAGGFVCGRWGCSGSGFSYRHYSSGGGGGRYAMFFKISMVTLLYLVVWLSLSFYHCII